MKQNYMAKLLLGGAFIVSGSLYAQKSEVQKQAIIKKIMADRRISDLKLSDERETPSFIQFDSKTPLPRYQTQYQLGQYLNLRTGIDELRDSKITHNKRDIDVQEYQQFYKGIPVEHAKYRALMRNENTLLAAGSYFDIPGNFVTRPVLTERQALNFALAKVGATKYAWQQAQEMMAQTNSIAAKQALQQEINEDLPNGQLVIVKDFTKEGAVEMRLAYKYNIYAAEPLSRDWIYVDAQTGKILLRNPIIHHASVPATVPTRYAGNRVVYTKLVSGNDPSNSGLSLVSSHPTSEPTYLPGQPTYVLFDDTRGGSIQTYDLNGAGGAPISLPGVYAQAKSFTDVDNNWTLAEHKRGPTTAQMGGTDEAENDDIAFDAHWGAEQVYDYWLKKHERLSYDNKNAAIRSYIHYGPAYDNAFWNGSVMTYGDGSGAASGFRALTSLDVCGHEIGHGVCSNTSDLVYEKESGAMNEGLSDIWASCIENFAIDSVDPSIRSRYQPFFIGEQISYTAAPLRYMDNPKGATDPDTYGGRYYVATNCTPSLANDQCGVHTNSGVINKYFYLLTVGSGNGTGPDREWARPGVDDQRKDGAGTTAAFENQIAYFVKGIGFERAEDITYMMEQMLSSTATFAEARTMSIAAATALAGNACDSTVESVMNAWNAVGVGDAFTTCVTTFGFVQAATTVSEASATGVGCNSVRTLSIPVITPAGGTITVTLGGTATLGDDYTVNTTSFSNNGTSSKTDQIVFSIKNDAIVENAETITLNIAVTGAGSSAINNTHTITITDNDVVPKIGTDSIILIDPATTGSFTASNGFLIASGQKTPGTVTLSGFTPVLEIGDDAFSTGNAMPNGKNQWSISNNQLVITGKLGSLTGDVALTYGEYNPVSASQTRIATNASLDARGLSNMRIAFDYTVQGEVDPATIITKANGEIEYSTAFDYMVVAYSLDGTNYTDLITDSFPRFASAQLTSGRFVRTLPSFLNNQQFFLAFRWSNDANAGGPVSVAIDNLSVKGLPKKIETTLNSFAAENLVAGSDVYYYSTADGDIIAKVNSAAPGYGCTSALVEKAGNSTFTFYSDGSNSHTVGDKIVRLSPTTNNATGTNTVSIYYTQAEINTIEAATLTGRSSLTLYKTTASNYTGAATANVEKKAALYQAITLANGTVVGGVFTATFNTGFSAFALGAPTAVILPVICTDFTAKLAGATTQLQWKVAAEVNNKYFEVERSLDGTSFSVIAKVQADAANKGLYTITDTKTDGLKAAYYRIRQYDADGRSTYICQTAYVRFGGKALVIGNMYPNPVTNSGYVQINTDKAFRLQADFINVAGQTVRSAIQNVAAGDNNVQVLKAKLPAGTYMIRLTDGETGTLLKTQTFIQQ